MATTRIPSVEGGIQPTVLTTTGDIIYASSASNPARLAVGSTNQVLGVTGGIPAWQASPQSTLTTTGDIIYASAANTPARLGIGTTGQVLNVSGGIPAWTTATSGGMTLLSTTTLSGASTTISGISGAYTNLQIEIVGVTNSTADGQLKISPNSSATISNGVGTRMVITVSINLLDMQGYMGCFTANWTRTDANNATLINIYNYANTTNYKNFDYTSDYLETSGVNRSVNAASGAIGTNSAISSIKLENTGGNFAGGTVYIRGVI